MQRTWSLLKTFLLVWVVCYLAACSQVENGHVGVVINKYGDNQGVSNQVLKPGWHWVGFNSDVYKFPTYTQMDKWTKSPHEGSPSDESIAFQAAGGIRISTDIGIAYHVEADKAPLVFQKYHRGIEEISDSFLRNMVRDSFNEHGTEFDAEALQSTGKQKLIDTVLRDVQKAAHANGIEVESLSYLADLEFPPTVKNAINAKIQATQDAMKVENQVRQTRAEAEKLVVTAEAKVKVAAAEAQATRLQGEALRANSEVLRLKQIENQAAAIEKWNGALPGYVGGNGPVPFIDVK